MILEESRKITRGKKKKKKELLLLPRIELNTANPRNDSSDEFDRS